MEIGTALSGAWSSGLSLYAVLVIFGVAGRLDLVGAPPLLEEPWFLAAAGALFVIELVVDKIALLDSVWDAAHTVIRPVGAAWLTSATAGQELSEPLAIAVGALLALSAHGAKATTRAMVNTSPEPVSNVVVSSVEDVLVGALIAFAIAYPAVALGVTFVLAVASGLAAALMFRAVRGVWRRIRRWRRQPAV